MQKCFSPGGSLDLSRTAITALPDNLSVGGNLYPNQIAVTSIPSTAKVNGKVYRMKAA
ncbi:MULTISPECIES: hypothetical protein [unclassified Bradyrhizobium]|uniref:hypothetical protein n=1 Tax=unclassified Bradyrhizobium TaxID=2631580 RepID=UPI0030CB3AC3